MKLKKQHITIGGHNQGRADGNFMAPNIYIRKEENLKSIIQAPL